MKTLGEKLKKARVRAGLTQEKVAGERMSTKTLQRLEDGDGNPTLFTLTELANAMKISLADLFYDRPTQPQCQKIPDLRESVGLLNHYLNAEQDTRLLALWILTDDDNYLIQYEKVSKHPAEAGALKRSLSRP